MFKGLGFPDMFEVFQFFILSKVLAYQKLCLNNFQIVTNNRNVKCSNEMHAHTCSTPKYVYKNSHESVFYNNIICKKFDTGIYKPYVSLHVPSRLPRVGLHDIAERWPNFGF